MLRSWDTLRLMGVLQRIALCFGAAAVLAALLGAGRVLWAVAALLLGYWVLCEALGAAGDAYSLAGWFGTAWDKALLGEAHLYRGEGVPFDPEGLASTPAAIAQVLLGFWVGQWFQARRLDAALVARLALWGTVLLAAGYAWQLGMPLNKKIWTSSYVLHTTGLALLALALTVQVVDIRARPRELTGWARCFEAFGRNPLFIFVLSGLVPRLLGLLRWQAGSTPEGAPVWTSPLPWAYQHFFAHLGSDPRLGSFLFALANLALYAVLALALDRQRLYIRV